MSIENRIYNFVDGYDSNGQSVYDIWRQAGNTSGAAGFIAYLNSGPQGEQGEIGPEGPQGRSAFEVWLAKEGNECKSEHEFFNNTKKILYMKGSDDGKSYAGVLVNGVLIFTKPLNIYVETEPKTAYLPGESFDPTGMVIMLKMDNGSDIKITNYTYIEDFVNNRVIVKYKEFEAIIEIEVYESMEFILQDFEYNVNSDGTYELTAWKGTYKGEASTKCVIPNHELIIA